MRIVVALLAALLAVALAACATAPPTAPPSPAPLTPKPASPRRRAPHVVKAPAPLEDAPLLEPSAPPPAEQERPADEVPAEEGIASYYADSLAGRRTANGERYRPEQATCAHRTHKFGTRLLVTALESGRAAECRVNDRGPWVEGRVIDVSKSVARQLGMIGPGLLRVRVALAED